MQSQWIDAELALKIVADGDSATAAEFIICKRAHAGLIRARARLFCMDEQRDSDCAVPREFWWAEGQIALEQQWRTGDFATWIDHKIEMRAYGVQFDLNDLLSMFPPHRRAIIARSLSVETDADWMHAREAHKAIAQQYGIAPQAAQRRLIEMARLGFAAARAVEMTIGRERTSVPSKVERECDVPLWFWQKCTSPESSNMDWASGTFGGRARGLGRSDYVHLTGVHFHRATILTAIPSHIDQANVGDHVEQDRVEQEKPPLPEAKLAKWWQGKSAISEGLTHDEIAALLRAAFPDNHVARDRIRALTGPRKTGPKPISG